LFYADFFISAFCLQQENQFLQQKALNKQHIDVDECCDRSVAVSGEPPAEDPERKEKRSSQTF